MNTYRVRFGRAIWSRNMVSAILSTIITGNTRAISEVKTLWRSSDFNTNMTDWCWVEIRDFNFKQALRFTRDSRYPWYSMTIWIKKINWRNCYCHKQAYSNAWNRNKILKSNQIIAVKIPHSGSHEGMRVIYRRLKRSLPDNPISVHWVVLYWGLSSFVTVVTILCRTVGLLS